MTTFATEFVAEAWPDLVAEFGETQIYTPLGGSPTSVTIIFHPNQTLPGYYPDGEQSVALAVANASVADIANPNLEDAFTINGAVWAVAGIGQRRPIVELQLERREQRRLGGTEHTVRR